MTAAAAEKPMTEIMAIATAVGAAKAHIGEQADAPKHRRDITVQNAMKKAALPARNVLTHNPMKTIMVWEARARVATIVVQEVIATINIPALYTFHREEKTLPCEIFYNIQL